MSSDINLAALTILQGIKIHSSVINDKGSIVNTVGDINGDGIDDFFIGFYHASVFYVFWGSATGLADMNLANFSSLHGIKITSSSNCITSVDKTGDVNKDGINDFILGFSCVNKAYLIFGSSSLVDIDLDSFTLTQGVVFTTNTVFDRVGVSVIGVGDINNDTIPDILIGASGVDNNKGAVYLVFGHDGSWSNINLSVMDSNIGVKIYCIGLFQIGGFINKIGDINTDGINDFAIGMPLSNNQKGLVVVIFGKSTVWSDISIFHLSSEDGFRIYGASKYSLFGRHIEGGDLNNDTVSDLVITAPGLETTYIVLGKNKVWSDITIDSLLSTDVIQISGAAPYRVAVLNDVNNNAVHDILIVDPNNNMNYLVFGKSNLENIDVANMASEDGIKIYVSEPLGECNISYVADAGDVNNDDINDFLIGTSYANNENFTENYVIFGGSF